MADLGLELYSFDPVFEGEYGEESQLDEMVESEISEDPTENKKYPSEEPNNSPSDLPLPPLPEVSPEEEFPPEHRFKYAEDSDFINLHQLPPLEKIFLCVSANASARRVWICNQLPLLLYQLTTEEGLAYVFPLMLRLCQDEISSVREALVENLDTLLLFYYQHKDDNSSNTTNNFKIDPESFVQLLSVSLFSSDPTLGEASNDSIIRFCQALKLETLEVDILPLFIRLLAEPEENCEDESSFDLTQYIQQSSAEMKLKVLTLLRKICPLFQSQTLKEVILPVIENNCANASYEIRKELLRILEVLLKLLPSNMVLYRVYPLYVELAQDSVYEVRQLACETLPQFSEFLISVDKRQDGIEWMERFLNDSSQKVKSTAGSLLGRFLYTFHESEIPEGIFKKYSNNCKSPKVDIRIGCAYYFPAVVSMFKSSEWHQLQPLFNYLYKDRELEIQRSLAASIHELAKLLSFEQVAEDLLPAFRAFISPSCQQEVQDAALNNASTFLIYISVSERSSLLPKLLQAFRRCLLSPDQTRPWRSKEPIIHQLGSLLKLSSLQEGIQFILPLLLCVARSKVPALVRSWAVEALPSFYHVIVSDQCLDTGLTVELFDQFDILLRSQNFRDRLLYILICRKMLESANDSNLDRFFLPNLSTLVVDKVVDVRLAVAKLLRDIYVDSQPQTTESNLNSIEHSEIERSDSNSQSTTSQSPGVRKLLTKELLSRFQSEEHQDIQSIVDSLTIQLNMLAISS